jgi:iron(III) transport system permease protein
MNRTVLLWFVVGWIGFLILPWYVIEDGFWGLEWVLDGYPFDTDYGPAWAHLLEGEKVWLAPIPLFLLLPFLTRGRIKSDPLYSKILIISGLGGLSYIVTQGFIVGIAGWEYTSLESLFGPLGQKQYGLGYGAMLVSAAFLFFATQGIAARGAVNGDVFVVSSIGFIVAIVGAFIFFPVSQILISALQDNEGMYSLGVFLEKFTDKKIWGLDCLDSTVGCGAAWNSLFLAITVGATTTALGLVFALVATRSGFRYRKVLRALTILPIITPPFVIGLSIILLFGLSGIMTQFFGDVFGIQPTRWVYGFPGIWIAQMLAYTPIAFLVMIGVVEGISPSMEEAAQTLRADRWKTFTTVSLPLMRPGLANAFLIGFIESMADFGNPLVLGGNFDVLSTEIFFAIVGAQNDQGMAAVLAFVLLCFMLTAFYAQRRWLGKKSYTTVTGKGDAGTHALLPNRLRWPIYTVAFSWTGFTIVVYCMILFGGFVNIWGLDHTFTFKHYITAFSVSWTDGGLLWTGAAWDSFWTTISIATISAPLTAAVGLLTAYVLVRQTFAGKDLFEFGTMLSFAIPGTVIGVSYILAFNVPPIELTGTGAILVLCFVFRNMPVGVRAGVAAMSQLDKSLDEASLTLGANSWYTFRKVVLPLLRPAIIAALVYSFVRAMTAISAVIFLVSAEYDMATSYIIGRVENNDYGLAIAYCTVLIFVMLVAVLVFQGLVGERKIGRREPEKVITPAPVKAI